ncbi:MAG: RHS repeat protein, partial [Candidatus Electrothrix sp. ATG1]|nr:RHS repeat protein [Candidatus Electrothrix sp. ATG1]
GKGEALPGIALSLAEMENTYGGCCGIQRPEGPLGYNRDNNLTNGEPSGSSSTGNGSAGNSNGAAGNSGENPGCGAPAWSVNAINLNLFVRDIPLWYRPAYGPSVHIAVSYNSQSATAQHEPFGNKWQFNYGSYLAVDTGGNVLIFMPDGRRDQYIPDGTGGYTRPYKVYNTLTKIAENHFELRFPDDTVYVYNIPTGTTSLQPFLVEIRDAYGQTLSFQYNTDIELTTITDAQGKHTVLTYHAEGLVTQVTDPFGRTALFEYDGNRNLIKITDMGGYWSTLSYDEDVYLTEIASALGAWQFYIEPTDDDTSASDRYPAPGEGMWENYRVTITDPLGGSEEYFYYGGIGTIGDWDTWYTSPRDYIPWQSDEMNNFTFDTTKTIYFLDHDSQQGQLTRIRYPDGNTISYDYDPSTGERTSISDAAGNTIHYSYNDMGRVTSVTDAKGTTTDFTYAANRVDLTQISNGLGTIHLTYNDKHDILSITDRLNTTTAFSYNDKGQRTSVTEAQSVLDRVTSYSYDPTTARLLQIAQGGNALGSYTYDSIGRVKTSTDATGLTLSYDYNDLNYLTRITYPDGKFSEKTYGSCCPGMVTSETDRSGKTTSYFYDELKRRVKTVYPDSTITQVEYDANGNLITLLDSNGNPTRFSYDLNNRLIQKNYADGKDEKFIYNNLGQLEQQLIGRVKTSTDATGLTLSYDYNDLNYLTKTTK